jgi:hypothetical protein
MSMAVLQQNSIHRKEAGVKVLQRIEMCVCVCVCVCVCKFVLRN